jgi:hypothetical protein
MVRVKEHLCDARSFVKVVKEGVMNREPNRPSGRVGDGRYQQCQFDDHVSNFRGGPNQCATGGLREGKRPRGVFGKNHIVGDNFNNLGRG